MLFEVAVILHNTDRPATCLVPPTPVMAAGDVAANNKALFLAKDADPDFNVDIAEVLVRPFR